MIKADLKHWAGQRPVEGPLKVDYGRFSWKAYQKLGSGGLVGVPNARGPDNPLGAEYRFEELLGYARKSKNRITEIEDGRVFHDNTNNIWFVKAQEISYRPKGNKIITYLTFGLPLGENLPEDTPPRKVEGRVLLLNAPSCTYPLESINLGPFSAMVVHASSAAAKPGTNRKAMKFYQDFIEDKKNSGAFAVSGGHRSPKEGLRQKLFSPSSIGSSFTELSPFEKNPQTLGEFYTWLDTSVRSARPKDLHIGTSFRETSFKHLPKMVQSWINGEKRTILYD